MERYNMYINESKYHLARANFWAKTYKWQRQRDKYYVSLLYAVKSRKNTITCLTHSVRVVSLEEVEK